MHSYAQTNVQLFNQLRSEGYSKKDRQHLLEVYEFGIGIFTGLFLPSGKTFIDHLVGTASILASLRVPINVVAAGLIHAAYLHGDFGTPGTGVSEAKRKRVRDAVGGDVEEYVARYDRLLWTPQTIPVLRRTIDKSGAIEREVLLMRLANELEHILDLGGLYFARGEKQQKWHQQDMQSYGPIMREMSEKLGQSSLSAEMTAAFRSISSAEIPIEPSIRSQHQVAYLIVPMSYRERFGVVLLRQAHRLFSKVLNRMRRLYQKARKSIGFSYERTRG